MTFANIYLTHNLLFKKNSISMTEENNNKKKSLSGMVLIITTVFIILTLPDNIMNAFFLQLTITENYGFFLLFFCDCLAFTYHGLHFAILIITNKVFKKELRSMLKLTIFSNKVGNNSNIIQRQTHSTIAR